MDRKRALEILQLNEDFSDTQLKDAKRNIILALHPDKHPVDKKQIFERLTREAIEAFEYLQEQNNQRYQVKQESNNQKTTDKDRASQIKEEEWSKIRGIQYRIENGDNIAMLALACIFYDGMFTVLGKDYDMAFKWFSRAALHGNSSAYIYLGIFHNEGLVGAIDNKQAIRCFKMALKDKTLDEDLKKVVTHKLNKIYAQRKEKRDAIKKEIYKWLITIISNIKTNYRKILVKVSIAFIIVLLGLIGLDICISCFSDETFPIIRLLIEYIKDTIIYYRN